MKRKLPKKSGEVGERHVSGWEKKKNKEANEALANKQKGTLHKL